MKTYEAMTIQELREFIGGKKDDRSVIDSQIRSAESALSDRIKEEAQTLVATLPQDQRQALLDALQKGSPRR